MTAPAPDATRPERPGILRRAAGPLVVAVAAVAVYAGAAAAPLHYDDRVAVLENPIVQERGRSLEAFTSEYWVMMKPDPRRERLYRPLTVLTFAANHATTGNAPEGYRWLNLVLHAACSLALLALGRRLGLGRAAAGGLGLLFALHPVHSEAVVLIVGRSDLLATLCVLTAMGVLLGRWRAVNGEYGESALPGWLPVSGALLALGLLSKEIGVALLLWVGLWWGWRRFADRGVSAEDRNDERRVLLGFGLVALAVLGAYLGLRYAALGTWLRPTPASFEINPLAHAPLAARWLGAGGVLGRYLRLLVAPWPLSIDYSYAQVTWEGWVTVAWAGVGLAGLGTWAYGAWRWRESAPGVALGLTLFLASWLPVSNLVLPVGTTMGERLLYLPSAGFLLAAVCAARLATPRVGARLPATAGALAAALYAGLVVARQPQWSDEIALWRATAHAVPRSAVARNRLGTALLGAGRAREAVAPLEESVRLYPNRAQSWSELGGALVQTGRFGPAEAALRRALSMDPDLAQAHYALAVALAQTGREEEARTHMRRAVEIAPHDLPARLTLVKLLLRAGDRAAAEQHLRIALTQDARSGEAHALLAEVLLARGDEPGARRHALEARRLGARLAPGLARWLARGG